MFIGTHTLLPVSLVLGAEVLRLARRREEAFPEWSIPLTGLFGALPDICSPHLSLEARYSSWSHSLLFLAAMLPLAAWTASWFPKGTRVRVGVACWVAALLHLAADAAAGGIPWLLPWNKSILGDYYIHPDYWIASDALFVVLAWLLLGLRSRFRRRI